MPILLAALLVLHNLCTAAAPPSHIRVRLLELKHPGSLHIGKVPVEITQGGLKIGEKSVKKARFEGPLEIEFKGETTRHKGILNVRPDETGKALLLILEAPLEDYVLGVASSEILEGRNNTAYVRALTRTVLRYTSAQMGRHKKKGYDFCDNTHCQFYRGLPADEARFQAMLEGLKIWRKGGGFFQKCCGGKLESEDTVWGKNSGGKILECAIEGKALCAGCPFYAWEAEIPLENWLEAASLAAKAKVSAMEASNFTPAGRHRRFRITTGKGIRELDAWKFYSEYGKRFGWADLHSLWFEFKIGEGKVKVKGRGLGHGVGLCQTGALELAQRGWPEDQILEFYFPD